MTNQDVFIKLKDLLDSISSLSNFYIGKSEDVERRQNEHWHKAGYPLTIEIAHLTPNQINELEKYLIENFLKSDIASKCDNKQIGGGNDKKPDTLYISLRFIAKQYSELDDDDINWTCCEL